MTTRRSRLQIRPNVGRGTGNDAVTKKTCVASKHSPKKEGKENAKSEESNLAEQIIEVTDIKISSKQPSSDKELIAKESNGILLNNKDNDISNIQSSSPSSFDMENVGDQQNAKASESYNTLLSTSRECTVVLERNIATTRKNTELIERCSSMEECSKAETAEIDPLHEKESYRERTPSSDTPQNVHRSELSDGRPVNLSYSDADKENDIVKSEENILEEDISTDSSGISQLASDDSAFVKPVVQNSINTSPERRPSNKTSTSEETSRRRNRFSKKPPERGTMTMMDLIFWNPPNNPMSQKKTEDIADEANVSVLQATEEEEEIDSRLDVRDDGLSAEDSSKTEMEMPGPRVMVGPNGDITIDEDSLVIRRPDPEQMASKKLVQEAEACTYNSFRKQKPKHYWSVRETAKFYKALSILGTDFSLMMSFFPKRSRQELKNKFKREEKLNRHLIDRAIRDPQQFDLTAFDDDDLDDNKGMDDPNDADFDIEKEMKKTRNGNIRRKSKKRRGIKNKGSYEDDDINEMDAASTDSVPRENIGTRKSSRKRKETSKEITLYSTESVAKKKYKPRVSKPRKKTEKTPTENESLEITDVTSENLEVVEDDQSVIISHSPSAAEAVAYKETPSSVTHINVIEDVQRKEMTEPNSKKDFDKQQDIRVKELNPPLRQLKITAPVISNNLLQSNSNQANFTPGQIVLVPGKTDNANEQVVHVYVVSPSPHSQQSLLSPQHNSEPADGVS